MKHTTVINTTMLILSSINFDEISTFSLFFIIFFNFIYLGSPVSKQSNFGSGDSNSNKWVQIQINLQIQSKFNCFRSNGHSKFLHCRRKSFREDLSKIRKLNNTTVSKLTDVDWRSSYFSCINIVKDIFTVGLSIEWANTDLDKTLQLLSIFYFEEICALISFINLVWIIIFLSLSFSSYFSFLIFF